ncbi:MAG: hypothetical protein LW650_04745 [Planctomycetaceae bacterium]|jgi:hypothetical protein|nr:hypothetical protein [Phycisphaerales bacterium]MCE2652815.1 hypothetical protein [Planctomycetaceae bacterium]
MFCTDRDLLVIEPRLFNEVSLPGQRLADGQGELSDSVLTPDPTWAGTLGLIGPGSVVVVAGVPAEVLGPAKDGTALTLSRLRSSIDAPALPLPDIPSARVTIDTFAPQIAAAHALLLARIGVLPDEALSLGVTPNPWRPLESQILRPRALWLVEALLAVWIIGRAAAGTEVASPFSVRARAAHRRALRVLAACQIEIDTDGDGRADAVLTPGVSHLSV